MRLSNLAFLIGSFSLLALAAEHDARACGGCFHPPTQTVSDITDERMLLSVSPTQTSLYDQIRYSGNPSSFAWVLPIHGTVDVELSADVLFDSIDAMTTTTIEPPESSCPPQPSSCQGGLAFGSANGAAPSDGVTVTKQQNVGPYETVQLHATDSSALASWLATNGFDIPAPVQPVISAYVSEGFDFLAMKLLPDQGITAMRPVRVTMPGASVSLPLRMAAIGTGASVGITIWVIADGRYEPQNFPYFHIADSELVWDWSTSSSNYTTLRQQHEQALGGKGWEIESSIALNTQTIANVIESGGQYYSGGPGGGGIQNASPSNAGDDYLAVPASDAGPGFTADEVRTNDVAALFVGMPGPNIRVTRIRSDISHAAMTTDFILTASSDQSELSNYRTVTSSINEQCSIYQGCVVVGTGSPAQAAASQALSGGGGCASAPAHTDLGTKLGLGAGLAGLALVRLTRRRRSRGKR
jgi:hypothetical protein